MDLDGQNLLKRCSDDSSKEVGLDSPLEQTFVFLKTVTRHLRMHSFVREVLKKKTNPLSSIVCKKRAWKEITFHKTDAEEASL